MPDPIDPPADPPKQFTPEEITNMVTGAANRIVKAELSKALKTELGPLLGEQLKSTLPALLKELKIEPPPADDPQDPKSKKPDPETAALRQKLAAFEQQLESEKKAREAAETKSKNDAGKSALRAALAPHVRPDVLDMVVDLQFDARKRVSFDDDGRPLFTIRQAPYAGAPEEDTPLHLADGVGHWLKSEEAKFFLPPPSPKGPPQQGGPRQPNLSQRVPEYEKPALTTAEKIQRANERAAAVDPNR